MTAPQSTLDLARREALALKARVSKAIAAAEEASWADVKIAQADIRTLTFRMQSVAEDQAGKVLTVINAAIAELEAAVTLVDNIAIVAKDDIRRVNLVIAASVHRASESLSGALDSVRTKLAHAIAPADGQRP